MKIPLQIPTIPPPPKPPNKTKYPKRPFLILLNLPLLKRWGAIAILTSWPSHPVSISGYHSITICVLDRFFCIPCRWLE